jgi:methyltransferase (TIGR00027 family)
VPHDLAVIDDPIAPHLVPRGYTRLIGGARFVPFGLRALHRIIGAATMGLSYNVPLRTAAIDAALREAAQDGIVQVVVLGAGLDGRAWRMPELSECTVFEIDHPLTQEYKRERTRDLPALCRQVKQCGMDFERDALENVLAEAGFDRHQRAFWIWEGVTMYLTRAAVTSTLEVISRQSEAGSRLAMTYLPEDYAPRWVRRVGNLGARAIGEDLHARFAPNELRDELVSRGLRLLSDDCAVEWARAYWPAGEQERVRGWERLAIAERIARL